MIGARTVVGPGIEYSKEGDKGEKKYDSPRTDTFHGIKYRSILKSPPNQFLLIFRTIDHCDFSANIGKINAV
jgi:hypothetical protein